MDLWDNVPKLRSKTDITCYNAMIDFFITAAVTVIYPIIMYVISGTIQANTAIERSSEEFNKQWNNKFMVWNAKSCIHTTSLISGCSPTALHMSFRKTIRTNWKNISCPCLLINQAYMNQHEHFWRVVQQKHQMYLQILNISDQGAPDVLCCSTM